ncbi:MAG TPA: class I SAM-dependent methyltransferase [Microbacteriaceae bacterium]|nr:class I SAM-dependent methyltransferase [Microbacteriaceae bacterium]
MSLKSRLLTIASQRFPALSSRVLASAGYTLDLDAYAGSTSTWSARTAAREDRAWQRLIAAAKSGHPREDIAALQQSLVAAPAEGTVLEVGCGGGYNSEIVAMASPGLDYTGLDLSAPSIELCRAHYPDRRFIVGSAYALPFEDGAFDVVVDGVALLHIPEWRRALAEYARVAGSVVILHGLTLTERPTTPFLKYAYGQPTFEQALNRREVEEAGAAHGLRVADRLRNLDYDLAEVLGIPTVSETWVLTR